MFGLSGKKDCRTCCLLVKILRKSVSSASPSSCAIDGKSLPQFWRLHRRRNESRRAIPAAEHQPDQAGAQYISLATIVARKTSCSDVGGMPYVTAKDAQGTQQTGTRREQTVDVICCSKSVVDDYSKNSNAGDSLNVQIGRRQLLCFGRSSSGGEYSLYGLGTAKSQIVVRCPLLNVSYFLGVTSQYWRPERLGMCHQHI